jgi:hypothetical protein
MSFQPELSTPEVFSTEFLTLADASKRLPRLNGKRVNTSTLWRWCRRGMRGVHLSYSKIGRTIVTTEESLTRFFTSLAQTDKVDQSSCVVGRKRKPRHTNSTSRQQAILEANAVLVRAGIIKPQAISNQNGGFQCDTMKG